MTTALDFDVALPKTYVAQPQDTAFSIMKIIVGKPAGQRIPLPHGVNHIMLTNTINADVRVYHAPANSASYWAFTLPACTDQRKPVTRSVQLWGDPSGGGFHLSTTAPSGQAIQDAYTVQAIVSPLPAG